LIGHYFSFYQSTPKKRSKNRVRQTKRRIKHHSIAIIFVPSRRDILTAEGGHSQAPGLKSGERVTLIVATQAFLGLSKFISIFGFV
jgi:hypothetical protein